LLTCPRCKKSFRITVPTSGTTSVDDGVGRIAQ
jgi:phage FluMu protein Com